MVGNLYLRYLVYFRPCLRQFTGLNWKTLLLTSPKFSLVFFAGKGLSIRTQIESATSGGHDVPCM